MIPYRKIVNNTTMRINWHYNDSVDRVKPWKSHLTAISLIRLLFKLSAIALSMPERCISLCFSEKTFSGYLAPHVGGAGVFVGKSVGTTIVATDTPAAETPTLSAEVNTREELKEANTNL